MIWVHLYASDGTLLLVCPAVDAELWWLLHGAYGYRYQLIDEVPPCQ